MPTRSRGKPHASWSTRTSTLLGTLSKHRVYRFHVQDGEEEDEEGVGRTPLLLVLVIWPLTTHLFRDIARGLENPGLYDKIFIPSAADQLPVQKAAPVKKKRQFVVEAQIRILSPPLSTGYHWLLYRI